MMCYKDMTFCSQQTCLNVSCSRLADAVVRGNAKNSGLDLCLSDLKDTESCPGYLDKNGLIEEVMKDVPPEYWREVDEPDNENNTTNAKASSVKSD